MSQFRDEWFARMKKQFYSLVDNKTWKLCELPKNRKVLGGRWIFALKKDENGQTVKHKARYLAKGFSQVFGSAYLETFAPTAKLSSIRLFLPLVIHFGCEVFQIDVSLAYLNADLEGEVFVQQPTRFEFPNKDSKEVRKLLKGLYGLKQAERCWNKILDKFLIDFGLTRSQIDSCCYSMTDPSSFRLFC